MTEHQEARVLANKVLDRPAGDPDDDLAILSRSLLRSDERIQKAADLFTNLAQILDVVKVEWGAAWSSWDQEQRDGITYFLTVFHHVLDPSVSRQRNGSELEESRSPNDKP